MNGIIVVDKPKGITSRDVVNEVSRIIGIKRVGHTGTLDPLATGVLVLCIGKATKISDLITNYNKEYIAEVTVGIGTDTLDIDGTVLKEVNDVDISKGQVLTVLKGFIGIYNQEVPKYSAVKVSGRKLYDYARNNITIELPKREVEIYDLSLIGDLEDIGGKIIFKIKCSVSKGTYIRSLIRDIGLKLGYPTCMSDLRRTKQGYFTINDCYSLDNVAKGDYKLLTLDEALPNLKSISVDKDLEKNIRNGSIIEKTFDDNMIKIINPDGELIAIYQTYNKDVTKAKPYKMLI
ncbi:MAG: tRNA pseudouridine(55) synthase TruB [Bacilli bacterium]|nr:tRNA pseudouridine(55) synthase TruB [Bacilli bacterium]